MHSDDEHVDDVVYDFLLGDANMFNQVNGCDQAMLSYGLDHHFQILPFDTKLENEESGSDVAYLIWLPLDEKVEQRASFHLHEGSLILVFAMVHLFILLWFDRGKHELREISAFYRILFDRARC